MIAKIGLWMVWAAENRECEDFEGHFTYFKQDLARVAELAERRQF